MTVLFNLFLALVWLMLTGSASPWNFVAGFLVGVLIVTAYTTVTGRGNYMVRLVKLTRFATYFFTILVKANIQIAKEVISPIHHQKPRILRYNVAHLTQAETTFLANCITLTPGTLVIDISPDNEWLYIHCMFAENPADALADIDHLADTLHNEVFAK